MVGDRLVLTLARDARLHHELYPGSEALADLHGRVVDLYGRSAKVKFLLLQDPSERIQVLLVRDDLSSEVWASLTTLSKGQAVRIRGKVGSAKSGKLSIIPTATAEPLVARDGSMPAGAELDGIGAQIILARLENRCRDYLGAAGFDEIAPRFLSSSWPNGGLQALRVQFPGQSRVPFFLAVSPHPQMLRALVSTGNSRLFSISRSFATNFVATQNGAEYSIATYLSDGSDLADAARECVAMISSMFHGHTTGLDEGERRSWDAETATWSQSHSLAKPRNSSGGLSVHVASPVGGLLGPLDVPIETTVNICWDSHLTIAEGYDFTIGGQKYIAMTVHIERLLNLLGTRNSWRVDNFFRSGSEDAGRHG